MQNPNDAAMNAIHEFLGIAQKNIYPQPDKPNSDWAKLKAAVDGLALLSESKPAASERWMRDALAYIEAGVESEGPLEAEHSIEARRLIATAPAAPAQSAEPVAMQAPYLGPVVIDRSHPNQAYVTYGFGSIEECTQFIKATRTGYQSTQPSPTAVVLDERAAFEAIGREFIRYFGHITPEEALHAINARAASPQPVEQTAPPSLTASFIDSLLSELWPLRPAVNERGHGTFEAVRSEIRRRLTEATVAQPVEQTRALTVEQKAVLDLAVLNLKSHGDDQLLAAVTPLIDFYARALTAARPASGETE